MKKEIVSMDASKWDVKYSIQLPRHPVQDTNGWHLDLKQDVSEIDYLLCGHNQPITQSVINMIGSVTCEQDVIFDHKTESDNISDGIPSSFRFLLYRSMLGEFNRWWSNPFSIVLQNGQFSLSVPLLPENFSSVNGRLGSEDNITRDGFYKVLNSPNALGLTFGGGYFFGHGIRVRNGDAKFAMNNFYLS